jgi:hypothetical protein
MEILGVLLGITMTVLAALVVYGYCELKKLRQFKIATADSILRESDVIHKRLAVLEKRKAKASPEFEAGGTGGTVGFGPIPQNNVAPQPRKGVRMRAWSEDIGAAGEAQ